MNGEDFPIPFRSIPFHSMPVQQRYRGREGRRERREGGEEGVEREKDERAIDGRWFSLRLDVLRHPSNAFAVTFNIIKS